MGWTGALASAAELGVAGGARRWGRERLAGIREQGVGVSEKKRVAVVMHKDQELDYRQIAGVLKLRESATKSLLFRAYETLREQLKEFVGGK